MQNNISKKKREQIYRSLRRLMKNHGRLSIAKELDSFRPDCSRGVRSEIIRELFLFYKDGTGYCSSIKRIHQCCLSELPELTKLKPNDSNIWWFRPGDYENRIKLLDRVLKEFKH